MRLHSARSSLVGLLAAVLAATASCDDEPPPSPATSASTTSSSGGEGGGAVLTVPDAGLPELPCQPGERSVEGGGCQPAGIPATSCGELFEPIDGGCRAILPAEPCAAGTMAVPGDALCREPAPCGQGRWGDIPVGADTQYVDGSYAGGDPDGTGERPWTTVQQGIDAAAAGAVVAVAEGSYDEAIAITDQAVRLWGVCPGKVELANTTAGASTIFVDNASGTEIHNLAVTGPHVGLTQRRSTGVLVEGVRLHDLGNLGIDVERTGQDVTTTLRDTLVERASFHAVFFYGADATLERVVVRETQLNSEGMRGRGIVLVTDQGDLTPSRAELRRVVSSDQHWIGIDIYGSEALIEDSLVADIEAQPGEGTAGYGIVVEDDEAHAIASNVVLRRVEIARATETGLAIWSSSVDAEALFVHGTRPAPAMPETGFGVRAWNQPLDGQTLTLRDALIEDNVGAGIAVSGGSASIEGALVRDTQPTANGIARGFTIEVDPESEQRPTVDLVGARVEAQAGSGIVVLGGDASLEGVAVHGDPAAGPPTVPSFGIIFQQELTTGAEATAAIDGSLVDSVQGMGIVLLGADGSVRATHVRESLGCPAAGVFGAGIMVQAFLETYRASSATIDRCLVERAEGMGIGVAAATADILHTVVRDTRGADGQFGDGVLSFAIVQKVGTQTTLLHPTITRIVSSHIDGAERAGVSSFATETTLEDSLVACTGFALAGEPFEGFESHFEDEGGNRCGCGDVVDACVVVSANLAPPTPIEP